MPLHFNFNHKYSVPNVLRRKFKFVSIDPLYTLTMSDKSTVVIDVRKQVTKAWDYVASHCAKSEACNKYFVQLHGGKTLASIMASTDFVIHLLQPRTDTRSGKTYTQEDLPQACTAGRDIGLSLWTFIDTRADTAALAAVLLHEIAHFDGATTNTDDVDALAAENALLHCGLRHYYQKSAKG